MHHKENGGKNAKLFEEEKAWELYREFDAVKVLTETRRFADTNLPDVLGRMRSGIFFASMQCRIKYKIC